jgi:catechol 2,3-dioxygenase-like lactoylglutathione lyase family enzyme
MDWTLEVVVLPVSDIDRAIAFYRDKVGFHLDHDTQNEHMHVVQLTPRGVECSEIPSSHPTTAARSSASVTPTALPGGRR